MPAQAVSKAPDSFEADAVLLMSRDHFQLIFGTFTCILGPFRLPSFELINAPSSFQPLERRPQMDNQSFSAKGLLHMESYNISYSTYLPHSGVPVSEPILHRSAQ